MKKFTLFVFLLFTFPSLACQLFSGGAETAVATPNSTIIIPTALNPPPTLATTHTLTPEASPSSTPPATETPTVCSYATTFLADVTIPDDSELSPGAAFTKTWRLRNSGNCPLPEGTTWVFTDGAAMSSVASYAMPTLAPNETAVISVNLTAPTNPGNYIAYWQVRLPDGTILRTRYFVRIIIPVPTPTATVPATVTPAVVPTITYFRTNVEIADPGDTIELQWATTNSDGVIIYRLLGGVLSTSWPQAPTGVMTYTIAASERNNISFALYAHRSGYDGPAVPATLSIPLTCPNPWFFTPAPGECAYQDAVFSAGAEQPFERGVMVWIAALERIYVLYDGPGANGEWQNFSDEWEAGDPVDDPSINPPPGLYQPQRGFGLVWRAQDNVQSRLGWATAPETAFNTAYQTTARFKYNEAFIRALDGNVWRLLPERSGWQKIMAE